MRAGFSILPHRGQELPGRRNQPVARVSQEDEKPSYDSSVEGFCSIRTVRGFLLLQIAIFLVLASIHFGVLLDGYRHRDAAVTESLIVVVMVAGLLLTWTPRWSRRAATAAQSFGALGALAGLLTIALGNGHRTILDLTLDGILLLTLIAGLLITSRQALRLSGRFGRHEGGIDRAHRAPAHADTKSTSRRLQ